MKILILLSTLAVVTCTPTLKLTEKWELWKKKHSKSYPNSDEEHKRFVTWKENKDFVDQHNQRADLIGFTMEMNKFGDLDIDEFSSLYNGHRSLDNTLQHHKHSKHVFLFDAEISVKDLPESVDWREKGYVTEVKNQSGCASCWAFSTTGVLEGQHFKATVNLVSLSEQNLIDCVGPKYNWGCDGGTVNNGYDYIIKNDGIDTEKSYPYKAQYGSCHFDRARVGAKCSSFVSVEANESSLQVAVATIGPISVVVAASQKSFQFYKGGVYYEPDCSHLFFGDHAMLAVGYGVLNGSEYWLVKNSFGTDWGMEGYILMSRNRDNNCVIANQATYPVLN